MQTNLGFWTYVTQLTLFIVPVHTLYLGERYLKFCLVFKSFLIAYVMYCLLFRTLKTYFACNTITVVYHSFIRYKCAYCNLQSGNQNVIINHQQYVHERHVHQQIGKNYLYIYYFLPLLMYLVFSFTYSFLLINYWA